MCCGKKRSAQRDAEMQATVAGSSPYVPQNPRPSALQQAATIRPSPPSLNLRYSENSAIRVRGPITGRQYEFSGSHPVQAVDTRDAFALLRSRLFRQT